DVWAVYRCAAQSDQRESVSLDAFLPAAGGRCGRGIIAPTESAPIYSYPCVVGNDRTDCLRWQREFGAAATSADQRDGESERGEHSVSKSPGCASANAAIYGDGSQFHKPGRDLVRGGWFGQRHHRPGERSVYGTGGGSHRSGHGDRDGTRGSEQSR